MSFLPRLLGLGRSRRRLVVALATAILVLASLLMSRLQFRGDVLELVPQSSRAVETFRLFVESFGGLDELYVLFEAPPGHEIAEYQALVDRFVEALEEAPEVEAVDASLLDPTKDWSYLFDRVFFLLGPGAAERQLGKLSPERMESELRHLRANVSLLSGGGRTLVQGDPFGFSREVRARFAATKAFAAFDPLADGYVSRDRRMRLAIVKPVEPPFDAAFCRRLMERLETLRRESFLSWETERRELEDDGEPLPVPRVDFAGAYRVSLEAESLIRGEMWRNSLVSLFLILFLVFVVFRSHWVLVCATLVLTLAGLLAMVSVGLWRGGLLAAASGGAAMLFGLGIDGVMVLYARHVELAGETGETATPGLVGTAFAVVLGNVTSVATFVALTWIDFPSLEEFGRLVGLGMLFCCGLTLLLVPAFWSFRAASRKSSVTPEAPSWPWLARFVSARSTFILGAAAVASLVALAGLARFTVQTDVTQLRPDTPGNRVSDEVQARFEFPEDVLIALARGPELEPLLELHRRLEERFASDPDVPSLAGPSFLIPPKGEQQRVGAVLGRFEADRRGIRPRLERAAANVGFRPGTFDPFADRLERLLDPGASITYEGLLAHGLGALAARYVAHERAGEGYVTATYLYPRAGVAPVEIARKIAAVSPLFEPTGISLVNAEVAAAFPFQLARGVILGGIAVFALIYASFKSLKRTLTCLAPTALGVFWSVGALAHLGYRFDLFGAFAFIMVIGIGVDYGIHVLERHAAGAAVSSYLPFTGAAVGLAALTTMIGFGTLMSSSYAPLSSLGLVTVVSVLAVAVASLVVLPAWLEVFGSGGSGGSGDRWGG